MPGFPAPSSGLPAVIFGALTAILNMPMMKEEICLSRIL